MSLHPHNQCRWTANLFEPWTFRSSICMQNKCSFYRIAAPNWTNRRCWPIPKLIQYKCLHWNKRCNRCCSVWERFYFQACLAHLNPNWHLQPADRYHNHHVHMAMFSRSLLNPVILAPYFQQVYFCVLGWSSEMTNMNRICWLFKSRALRIRIRLNFAIFNARKSTCVRLQTS